jgi:hypothetical protein
MLFGEQVGWREGAGATIMLIAIGLALGMGHSDDSIKRAN